MFARYTEIARLLLLCCIVQSCLSRSYLSTAIPDYYHDTPVTRLTLQLMFRIKSNASTTKATKAPFQIFEEYARFKPNLRGVRFPEESDGFSNDQKTTNIADDASQIGNGNQEQYNQFVKIEISNERVLDDQGPTPMPMENFFEYIEHMSGIKNSTIPNEEAVRCNKALFMFVPWMFEQFNMELVTYRSRIDYPTENDRLKAIKMGYRY